MNRISQGSASRLAPYVIVCSGLCFLATLLVWSGVFTGKEAFLWFIPLVSTFFGAMFAFRLTEQKEGFKELDRQRAALNRALLVLGTQWNEVVTSARMLRQYKTPHEQALVMPAWEPPPVHERIPIEELFFLVDGPDPNILIELIIEQQRFDQCLTAIRLRGKFYVDTVQPAMLAGKVLGRQVALDQAIEAIGSHIYAGAMQGADAMRKQLLPSEKSLKQMIERLLMVGKALHPSWRLIKFEQITTEAFQLGSTPLEPGNDF